MFGDKVEAKEVAHAAGLETIPGTEDPVKSLEEVQNFAHKYGYPIMVKAAMGGGGRGMRVVNSDDELPDAYNRARSEAKQSFGDDELYVEKYLENPKHIEVQILGDKHGNVLHLFERDCSVQRRHQKVIEFAPSIVLSDDRRKEICDAAVRLAKSIHYQNAGTVEFLVTDDAFYFIEVNPRIQVEHTITEMITEIDLVQSQILVAAGKDLFKDLHLPKQEDMGYRGCAIQCRITTEDSENNFMPDTGKIETYRSPGGFGVRLDGGNAYAGAVVTPYFDSLLVKVCVQAKPLEKPSIRWIASLANSGSGASKQISNLCAMLSTILSLEPGQHILLLSIIRRNCSRSRRATTRTINCLNISVKSRSMVSQA